MSNFQCEKCGADITEGPDGRYVTACDHWPLEPVNEKPSEMLVKIQDTNLPNPT